jgi:hypothetical protein
MPPQTSKDEAEDEEEVMLDPTERSRRWAVAISALPDLGHQAVFAVDEKIASHV